MKIIRCMIFMGLIAMTVCQRNLLREIDSLFKQNYDLFDLHIKLNSLNIGRDTNKLRIKSWIDFHHLQ